MLSDNIKILSIPLLLFVPVTFQRHILLIYAIMPRYKTQAHSYIAGKIAFLLIVICETSLKAHDFEIL